MVQRQLNNLGFTIRRLRAQRGFQLNVLADAVGVPVQDMDQLEGGGSDPKYSLIASIAEALGVEVAYLLGASCYLPFKAETVEGGLELSFRHGRFDAVYFLPGADQDELALVLNALREGLAGNDGPVNAIVDAFLNAVRLWPHANPSDLWLFLVNRAYCDHANHLPGTAPGDISQSWKRSSGYALEAILRAHYGKFLAERGLFVHQRTEEGRKLLLQKAINDERVIPDKADVLVTRQATSGLEEELVGVIHVKASIAERRTDDVPLSDLLLENGYLSVFWTFDCKSFPRKSPVNSGEYGGVSEGKINDKRRDLEEHGYFSACFSYNRNTLATVSPGAAAQIYVCDFRDPDDAFSQFLLAQA